MITIGLIREGKVPADNRVALTPAHCKWINKTQPLLKVIVQHSDYRCYSDKEYVQAARVIGVNPPRIMLSHVLPNVMGPVLVIATLNLGLAILSEATLSFLGVGVPATQPSLGTLIRIGNDFLFSGEWWITIFPGVTLIAMVLSVNLLGDWLRDALNPKLR